MAKSESRTRIKYSESEGIDRISSLPEALHSKILSLLPTKNAVATSILSKRWKFVWTCITNLTFDDGYFNSKDSGEAHIMNSQKFIQFVNNVLVKLNPPFIQNFYLSSFLPNFSDSLNIQSLVCAAIDRTIQNFELHLKLDKRMELPLSHFNGKTLTVLKLSKRIHFNVVASASVCFPNLLTLDLSQMRFTIASDCSVSFPSLKDLHLEGVIFANQESVHKLFASCPVLDSLRLRKWYYYSDDNLQVFIISIPSLRRLVIGRAHHIPTRRYKIQIDTPALDYLHLYYDSFCQYFTLEKLSCLHNAEVTFCFDPRSDTQLDTLRKIDKNISKIIVDLVGVRFLSISGRRILQAIGSMPRNIAPVFRNLTRLKVGIYICRDSFMVIKNLLGRSDNLEHLIMKGRNSCGSHESRWIEPLRVPKCLLLRVTTITLTNIGYCSTEFDLVRYFLKNANVLELFTISFSGSSEEKSQLMQKISTIPRRSRTCQIKFG